MAGALQPKRIKLDFILTSLIQSFLIFEGGVVIIPSLIGREVFTYKSLTLSPNLFAVKQIHLKFEQQILKRQLFLIILLLVLSIPTELISQSGGRQREGGGGRRKMNLSFKRTVSAGHADKFARARGRKGPFARLFRRDRPAWVYRPSGSKKSNWKDNKFLFSRHRTPGKIENSRYQDRARSKRDRHRVRGNESSGKRRHR
jgi:hypothetical protein